MEKLQIFNTLNRKKQEFKPLKPKEVSFYHCGPTVYWTQHIGNMRAMVLADLISRSLDYLGFKVKLVRNYTDVGHLTSNEDEGEDKMEKSAKTEKTSPKQIADKYIKIFEKDIKDLNVEEAWKKPLATKHIKEMIKMVEALIKNGYAYSTDLAVYFDISKFKNYTKLSGQDLEKNISKAGKADVSDPDKKNSADFALWFFKAGVHKNALQTWKSPFNSSLVKGVKGREGFPGWHIECSAMSKKYLGDTLDIHMGGVEHIPVHHTNEIAQSEGASGKTFVNYWLHNEHLNVDGGKMAKSVGTAYSVAEIKAKGYDPLVLRYFFLQAHYRSKQNFTWKALDAAQSALNNLRDTVASYDKPKIGCAEYEIKFEQALKDDFNIPKALAIVWDLIKDKKLPGHAKKQTLLKFDEVLGLDLVSAKKEKIPAEVMKLAKARQKAREDKDFSKADKLRITIEEKCCIIEDIEDGFIIKIKK